MADKPLKRMNREELLWLKSQLMQRRRKMDLKIKKVNMALAVLQNKEEQGKWK